MTLERFYWLAAKPVVYVLLALVFAKRVAAPQARPIVRGVALAVLRLALGVALGIPASSALPWRHQMGDMSDVLGTAALTLLRFVLWWGLTKALFAKTSNARVSAFAGVATLFSMLLEWLAVGEIGPDPAHFNVC